MTELGYLDTRIRIDPKRPEVALQDLQKTLEQIFGKLLVSTSADNRTTGVQYFPSGIKFQWGTVGRTGAGNITVTYRVPFNTAAYSIQATFKDCVSGLDGQQTINIPVASRTTTGCVIAVTSIGALGALTVDWNATGY